MSKTRPRDQSSSKSARSRSLAALFVRNRDKKGMSGDDYDDDRYEIYSPGEEFGSGANSKKGPPEPDLGDYMGTVLVKKQEIVSDRLKSRSRVYNAALQFSRLLVTCAYDRHTLLKTYIRATKGRPDISHFRAVDQNTFTCLVPLKRPARPGTFKIIHKNPREFPSHRILVRLDDRLSNLEQLHMSTEWGHCVDTAGIMRPDLILTWFNDGLKLTCDLIKRNKVESHYNFEDMSYGINNDGTMTIKISSNNEDIEGIDMKINILPCLVLPDVPKQMNIRTLFPSRRPHFELNSKFKHLFNNELEYGKELLFLKASLENVECFNGYEPNITNSWALYTELLEDLALKFVREENNEVCEEDLRFVLDEIKHNSLHLHPIPSRIINNCMLILNKKLMGQGKSSDDWFIELLKLLESKFRCQKFPAFFIQKLDLLSDVDDETSALIADDICKLLSDLESDPSLLLKYTGYGKESENEDDEEVENTENNSEAD